MLAGAKSAGSVRTLHPPRRASVSRLRPFREFIVWYRLDRLVKVLIRRSAGPLRLLCLMLNVERILCILRSRLSLLLLRLSDGNPLSTNDN